LAHDADPQRHTIAVILVVAALNALAARMILSDVPGLAGPLVDLMHDAQIMPQAGVPLAAYGVRVLKAAPARINT